MYILYIYIIIYIYIYIYIMYIICTCIYLYICNIYNMALRCVSAISDLNPSLLFCGLYSSSETFLLQFKNCSSLRLMFYLHLYSSCSLHFNSFSLACSFSFLIFSSLIFLLSLSSTSCFVFSNSFITLSSFLHTFILTLLFRYD